MSLIAIEGIDGSGKTSVCRELVRRLPDLHLCFGGMASAADLNPRFYRTLDDVKNSRVTLADPILRALPFTMARAANKERLVLARSGVGGMTLLDRYVMTNAAYVYAATFVETASREQAEAAAGAILVLEFNTIGLPAPDLTIVVRCDPLVAQRRLASCEARKYDSSPEAAKERDLVRLANLDYAFSEGLRDLYSSYGAVRDVHATPSGEERSVPELADLILDVIEKEVL